MDTLIFAGMLGVLILMYRQRSRPAIVASWWIVTIVCCLFLKVHITSGLGLGLTW
ncbi:DUF5993 family protein [Mycolicibacterium sp. 050232]|uniref:DUF5993 family protein n=1 Tax=Mycolicibacterium sp. 050232 TaxID=3113982 RepID=UPI003FA5378E